MMIRGTWSSPRPSTRSWNGVVNARSSATWTDSQEPAVMVRNRRRPSAEMVRSSGPSGTVAMISVWTVKISGNAASVKGSAMTAPRESRNGPRPAVAEHATSTSQIANTN